MSEQGDQGDQGNQVQDYLHDDDISLRDILLKVRAYFQEIVSNWKLVGVIVLVFVVFMLARAFSTPKKYEADLTFTVNEDEGSQLGGVAGVLEDLGFGGATNSEYNLDKILELLKSRQIIFQTLVEKDSIDGKMDYLGNHLIRTYNLDEEWKSRDKKLEGFQFTQDSVKAFNRLENKAMQMLYKMLIDEKTGDNLLSSSISETSGIMTIKLVSLSEELSNILLRRTFNRLSKYYINQTVKKQLETHKSLQFHADSIGQALASKERELALFIDQNQFLVTQKEQLKRENLERDIFILSTMYGEVVKNLQISGFALQNKTPFVQAIDYPVLPLKVVQVRKIPSLFYGLLLGLFVSIFFILGRKLVKDALQDDRKAPPPDNQPPGV